MDSVQLIRGRLVLETLYIVVLLELDSVLLVLDAVCADCAC